MKSSINRLLLPVFVLLFVAVLWSPDPVMPQNTPIKFGFVDVKRLFDNFGKVQALSQELRTNLEKYDQKKTQWEDKIRTEIENFKVQRDLMGDEAIKQKQAEITNMQRDMATELGQAQKDFQDLEDEGMAPIITELNEIVRNYAKENGYDFIFKKQYVAYIDEKYDITDEIIALLDK